MRHSASVSSETFYSIHWYRIGLQDIRNERLWNDNHRLYDNAKMNTRPSPQTSQISHDSWFALRYGLVPINLHGLLMWCQTHDTKWLTVFSAVTYSYSNHEIRLVIGSNKNTRLYLEACKPVPEILGSTWSQYDMQVTFNNAIAPWICLTYLGVLSLISTTIVIHDNCNKLNNSTYVQCFASNNSDSLLISFKGLKLW